MRVEYTIVSAPLQKGGPSEDAVIVSEAGGGRPFYVVVVDGHGHETDEQGRAPFKSATIARYARDIAAGLREQFDRFPDPNLFPDHFDAVAQETDGVYRPLVEAEHDIAQLSVGAVSTAIVVTSTHIHQAQVGDCRLYCALPSWQLGFRRLSVDHNGDHLVEIQRLRPLLRSGNFWLGPEPSGFGLPVLPSNTPDRLYRREGINWVGGLAPTRVFGDWEYLPAVTHVPECRSTELSEFLPGELFALCSDGGNRIVEAAFKHFRGRTTSVSLEEVAAFARALLPEARDDVTIVFFRVVPA